MPPKRKGRAVKTIEEESASPKMPLTRKRRAVEAVEEEKAASSKMPSKRKRRAGEEEEEEPPKRKRRAIKAVEHEDDEPASTERAQKRTKPADIIDDMEDLMNDLKPSGIRVARSMFDIPRDLLKPGTSMSTLDTQLKEFKTYFQLMLELVIDQQEEIKGGNVKQSQLIFQSVARISS